MMNSELQRTPKIAIEFQLSSFSFFPVVLVAASVKTKIGRSGTGEV